MDNLICTECGTTYYSAAAGAMIERGERCDCGSLLRAIEVSEVPVGGPPAAGSPPSGPTTEPYGARRRFSRD
jgi:hypothetical protein